MFVKEETINDYKNHGVALLRNVIANDWLEKLAKGIKKTFKTQANINVFMKKKMVKKFSMMTTAIGRS